MADPDRPGKCGHWRAMARFEIRAALSRHSISKGVGGPHRDGDEDSNSNHMTLSRQVQEMRMYEGFRRRQEKERQYLASQALRRSAGPEYDRATRDFLRRSLSDWLRVDPKIYSLEALCVRHVVRDLQFVNREDIEALATMPPGLKAEILRQTALVAMQTHSNTGRPRGIITNEILVGLLDGNMTYLQLRCSEVTDDFVHIIEPSAEVSGVKGDDSSNPKTLLQLETVDDWELSADDYGRAEYDMEQELAALQAKYSSEGGENQDASTHKVTDEVLTETVSDGLIDSWEAALLLHDAIQVRGVHKLTELDISFCPNLTEDVVELLAQACPGLQALSLAGNFNTGESSFYLLCTLGNEQNFRTLRYLDVSCCAWASFELMLQAGFLSRHRLETLRMLRAEVCPEITKVIEMGVPVLPPYGKIPQSRSSTTRPFRGGGENQFNEDIDEFGSDEAYFDDGLHFGANSIDLVARRTTLVEVEEDQPALDRLINYGFQVHKGLEWFSPPSSMGVEDMKWILMLSRGGSRSRALRVATSYDASEELYDSE